MDQAHLDAEQRKTTLATPNYGYEKRQRELAKKAKKAEKLREKADRKHLPEAADQPLEHASELVNTVPLSS